MTPLTRLASFKFWLLSTVVAAAVLVPLYSNPLSMPVTHAEWGRMLVRALDMEQALPARAQASLVFSLLSWKSSLAFAADQYATAEGVTLQTERGRRSLKAIDAGAEVSYPLAILRSGDYHLRLRLSGDPGAAVTTEISTPANPVPVHRFAAVSSTQVSTWVDVGSTHLDRGQYFATLALPQGAAIERVEVGPPCLSPVEPPGGWRATEAATPSDIAVTAIEALNLESQLPPADMPTEIPGSQFIVTAGSATLTAPAAALGPEATWLKAGPQGLRAMVVIDVTGDGLYTLETFGGTGRGQRWLADACRKAIVCPSAVEATLPEWREILTARFSVGRHMLAVTLAPRAVVQRIRLVRKKDGPEDYVAALRQLGFDVGQDAQVSRRVAVDAMDFVRARRRQMLGLDRFCGDTIDVGVPVNIAQGPGAAALPPPVPPVVPPAVVPPAPPVPPAVPPLVPPQTPSSPITP
jgi:hypothetical protein